MRFEWIDYCGGYEGKIEAWMNDKDIIKFVSDHSWKEEYEYYLQSDEYELYKSFFCKVIKEGEHIIACLILLWGDRYPLVINPIIVNPQFRNKGYGSLIIQDLIDYAKIIVPNEYKYIEAGINIENKASIKLFEKCGFKLDTIHPDGDFLTYRYLLSA